MFMYNQTLYQHRKHFCMYCLQAFSSEDVLTKHQQNCIIINSVQGVTMPEEGETLQFKNYSKQMPVPFVIYADFEAITRPVSSCKPDDTKSYSEAYQMHEDCGYGYKVVFCYDDKYSKPIQIYRGENAVYNFMEELLKEAKRCKMIAKKSFNKPLLLTEEGENDFQMAEKYCKIEKRVRDHCHITGKFRGSAHNKCNSLLKIDPNNLKIPLIFHNLKGYDSHFIMQQIGSIIKNHSSKNYHIPINVIPNSMENIWYS